MRKYYRPGGEPVASSKAMQGGCGRALAIGAGLFLLAAVIIGVISSMR